MIYTTCSRRYLSFSGLVQFASAKQPQAADGRGRKSPRRGRAAQVVGHGAKLKTIVFARCGFPTGKPRRYGGLDRSRGPRLLRLHLALAGGTAARFARRLHPEDRGPGYAPPSFLQNTNDT